MAEFKNVSESGLIKSKGGKLNKIIINSHSSGTVALVDGTGPSVAGSQVLTSAGASAPAVYATQTITQSVGAGTPADYATQTLTSSGAGAPAAHALQTLTSNGKNVSDGDTITVASTVYTFKKVLASAYDVKIGDTAHESLVNLYKAVNATGVALTNYFTGTLVHPTAIAYNLTDTTFVVVARTIGTGGNSIATTSTATNFTFGDTTMAGGVATTSATITVNTTVYTAVKVLSETYGLTAAANQVKWTTSEAVFLDNLKLAINGTGTAGTHYGTGTVAHTTVIATANTDTTQVVYARTIGTAANSYPSTATMSNYAWGNTTLLGGVAVSAATITIGTTVYTAVKTLAETIGLTAVAYQVLWVTSEAVFLDNLKSAINAIGTAGTDYGTGTAAHPDVIAYTNTNTTQVVVARVIGTAANSIATTATMTHYAWGNTTLLGGVATTVATVTIGTRVYTAVTGLAETYGLTAVKDQILWVTSEEVFLDNLKSAINGSGTVGTDYSTGTTPNYDVYATTNTATQQTIVSKLLGVAQNLIATTTTLGNYSWGAATLASGAGPVGKVMHPTMTLSVVATTGERVLDFGDEEFINGLYITVGGTANLTLVLN
jgi:hypothetical protein